MQSKLKVRIWQKLSKILLRFWRKRQRTSRWSRRQKWVQKRKARRMPRLDLKETNPVCLRLKLLIVLEMKTRM